MQRRRLAAIMFSDVVGYTALMGKNEDKAIEILRINKEIHTRLIEKYYGTLIKEMGDGILTAFDSSVDAVKCALEIQIECKKKNIPLKIGIHEGDMIFEGKDVLGDGVNIASRLEAITETGKITISEAIYRNVRNKPGIHTAFLEQKQLKNVEEPLKIYEVSDQEIKTGIIKPEKVYKIIDKKWIYFSISAGIFLLAVVLIWQFLSTKKSGSESKDIEDKSIAVLPFTNDSPDQENEYFCNGMMEDILTNLQRISDLRVKSRTDVEQYRDNKKTISIMGAELGVAYILEGSVRKAGENLRITAQLIDVLTGDHLWANTYDGKYTDEIFVFQNNTAKEIAAALNVAISPDENKNIEEIPASNLAAYDFYIRAKNEFDKYWSHGIPEYLNIAHKHIDQALRIDPQYLKAIQLKGNIFQAERNIDSVYTYAQRLLKMDSENAGGYDLMARYYNLKNLKDSAQKYNLLALSYTKPGDLIDKKSIEFNIGTHYFFRENDIMKALPYLNSGFNPKKYGNYSNLSHFFLVIGDSERANMYNEKMIELRPEFQAGYIMARTKILEQQREFNDAIDFLDSICIVANLERICNAGLFMFHTLAGQYELAEQYYNQALKIYGKPESVLYVYSAYMYKKLGKEKVYITMCNEARTFYEQQLVDSRSPYNLFYLSIIHALLDEKEKSLQYLAEATDKGPGTGWYIDFETDPKFENLWNDPEFKVLVKRYKEKLKNLRKKINQMRERGEIYI